MPFTLYWDGQGIVKRLSGFVTAREFMESAGASTSHPRFDEAQYVINDFSGATGLDIDEAATEYVAVLRLGASASKRHLRVIYVSGDPVVHSFVARLGSPPFDCSWETRVFATLPEAEEWLSRQPRLSRNLA